jgi:hypothetical protein
VLAYLILALVAAPGLADAQVPKPDASAPHVRKRLVPSSFVPARGADDREAWIATLAASARPAAAAQRRPPRMRDPFGGRCSTVTAALIGAAGGFGVGAIVGARNKGLPGPWIDGALGASFGALAGVLICGG